MGCEMSQEVATLKRMDTKNLLALPSNFRSSATRIRQDEVVDFISLNEEKLSPASSPYSSKHFSPSPNHQPTSSTSSSCASGLLEDGAFPADSSSLDISGKHNWSDIIWLRPHELCSSPKLFVDGVSKNDVKQGILGDCWLLSACAAVAEHHNLLERVIEPQQTLYGPKYQGAITFHFWRFGEWIPIIIDDRLPTRSGKLIFANCTNDEEFWLPLLEKAFAKLHDSYYALEGGHAEAAFAYLTGGVTERLFVRYSTFDHLQTIFQHGAFVTCSVKDSDEDRGLVGDHAYTITAVANVETKYKENVGLVRLRSPWADHVEWTGDWSDKSKQWDLVIEDDRERCSVKALHDGEFWISFQDFSKHFCELTIATLGPDFDHDGAYDVHRQCEVLRGEWAYGSAGGSRNDLDKFQQNPQYLLKVEETMADTPNNFLIALMQLPNHNSPLLPIAFFVYKTEAGAERLGGEYFLCEKEEDKSGDFTDSWQVILRTSLRAADYVIIPATFAPDSHSEFLLRVYAIQPFTLYLLRSHEED